MRETMVTVVGAVVGTVRTTRVGDDRMRASFRVASTARRYDKRLQEWVDGDSLYVTVVSWGRLAEGVGSSLAKGDPVIAQGRLFTREWTDDAGQNRSVVEMEAVAVGPDLTRSTATVRRYRADAPAEPGAQAPDGAVDGRADGNGPAAGRDPAVPDRFAELAAAARPLVAAPV